MFFMILVKPVACSPPVFRPLCEYRCNVARKPEMSLCLSIYKCWSQMLCYCAAYVSLLACVQPVCAPPRCAVSEWAADSRVHCLFKYRTDPYKCSLTAVCYEYGRRCVLDYMQETAGVNNDACSLLKLNFMFSKFNKWNAGGILIVMFL